MVRSLPAYFAIVGAAFEGLSNWCNIHHVLIYKVRCKISSYSSADFACLSSYIAYSVKTNFFLSFELFFLVYSVFTIKKRKKTHNHFVRAPCLLDDNKAIQTQLKATQQRSKKMS